MSNSLEQAVGRAFLIARELAVHAPPKCSSEVFTRWRLSERLLASILKEKRCPLQVDGHLLHLEVDNSIEVLRLGRPHRGHRPESADSKTEESPNHSGEPKDPEQTEETPKPRKRASPPVFPDEWMSLDEFLASGVDREGQRWWDAPSLSRFAKIGIWSLQGTREKLIKQRPDVAKRNLGMFRVSDLGRSARVANLQGVIAILELGPKTESTTRALSLLTEYARTNGGGKRKSKA